MTKDEVLARIASTAPKAVKVETKLSGEWFMVRPNGARRWVLLDLQAKLAKSGQFRIPPAAVVATAVCDESGAALFAVYDAGYASFSEMEFSAREDRFELPDGNWALALNGVKNPGRLEWPKDRPWAPIVERVAGKDGVDRYKHADGSWSWTQPQWRKDLNRMDSVTVLANPTPTLPMLPEEAAANTPPPAGSPDKKP